MKRLIFVVLCLVVDMTMSSPIPPPEAKEETLQQSNQILKELISEKILNTVLAQLDKAAVSQFPQNEAALSQSPIQIF